MTQVARLQHVSQDCRPGLFSQLHPALSYDSRVGSGRPLSPHQDRSPWALSRTLAPSPSGDTGRAFPMGPETPASLLPGSWPSQQPCWSPFLDTCPRGQRQVWTHVLSLLPRLGHQGQSGV